MRSRQQNWRARLRLMAKPLVLDAREARGRAAPLLAFPIGKAWNAAYQDKVRELLTLRRLHSLAIRQDLCGERRHHG